MTTARADALRCPACSRTGVLEAQPGEGVHRLDAPHVEARCAACGHRGFFPALSFCSASSNAAERARVVVALRAFVSAAVEVDRAWEVAQRGGGDARFSEAYPPWMPSFGRALDAWILWRDATARALGMPEGNGFADDEAPPRPASIPDDEPEDPALDIANGDGTTRRARLEAEAGRDRSGPSRRRARGRGMAGEPALPPGERTAGDEDR